MKAPVFFASENPKQLEAWGILHQDNGKLVLSEGVFSYELNTPLFSDYAHKLRTIWMPEGVSAKYHENEAFEFPVGTIISKTFYYPRHKGENGYSNSVAWTDNTQNYQDGIGLDLKSVRLVETRLLVRRVRGWEALPYVWNEDQKAAVLKRTGKIISLERVSANAVRESYYYVVPNTNQCAGCHATNNTTREISPIGPKARHLNKRVNYADGVDDQLSRLVQAGYLEGAPKPEDAPRNARWNDPLQTLDARARAYLDANCSHCHNSVGPADTSGLFLDPQTVAGPHLGICKIPVAAGGGTGDRSYDIVPGKPDASVLEYRLASTDPSAMMPELGRTTAHKEGVDLIRAWILEMEGGCEMEKISEVLNQTF